MPTTTTTKTLDPSAPVYVPVAAAAIAERRLTPSNKTSRKVPPTKSLAGPHPSLPPRPPVEIPPHHLLFRRPRPSPLPPHIRGLLARRRRAQLQINTIIARAALCNNIRIVCEPTNAAIMRRHNTIGRRMTHGNGNESDNMPRQAPNFSRRTSQAYPVPRAVSDNYDQHQNFNNQDYNNTHGFGAHGAVQGAESFQGDYSRDNNFMFGASRGSFEQPAFEQNVEVQFNHEPIQYMNQSHMGAPIGGASVGAQQAMVVAPNFEELAVAARSRLFGFHADNPPPFVDNTRGIFPSTLPVIRIEGVPYAITQSEISMWMAKHMFHYGNKEGSSVTYPIHILMDRSTGKSMDVWIELPLQSMADQVMHRYTGYLNNNTQPRISNRVVSLEWSTQGELMKAIFPIAKDLYWDPDTGIPILVQNGRVGRNGEPVSGFRGFLSKEELYCCVNHSIHPSRVPSADKCPQRGYESMLATVLKFPWASTYYTVIERDQLFESYFSMLTALITKVWDKDHIASKGREVGMSVPLARTFVTAGLRCPGFSERQKNKIVEAVAEHEEHIAISRFSRVWPFSCIGIPYEVSDGDLEEWMQLFDHGCHKIVDQGENEAERIRLCRDDEGYWLVVDKFGLAVKSTIIDETGVEVEIHTLSYYDFAQAESEMMKRIMNAAWESFFAIRQIDYKPKEFPDLSMETSVAKKMLALGCFEEGGIEPPKIPQAGDDIVQVPVEHFGAWHDLMTCTTNVVPIKSATEALDQVGLVGDAHTEAAFQKVQAVIRGDLPLHTITLDTSAVSDGDLLKRSASFSGNRPGHGSWHPDVTAGRFNPYKIIADSDDETDEDDDGVDVSPPHAGIQSVYASGTYSAPTTVGVNFAQIANQVIATKSVDNTPVRFNAGRNTASSSPIRSRHSSPQRDTIVDPFENATIRRPSPQRAPVNDPFTGSTSRQSSPERGSNVYVTSARRGSPHRGGVPPRDRKVEVSPCRRGRSVSPNKNSYTIAQTNPSQSYGAIGTPSRTPSRRSTIVPEPTILETDEEDWPTPGRASTIARGRSRRH